MVKNINADYLRKLRANADQIRDDLEERERVLDEDPLAMHDALMATRPPPQIVYKKFVGRQEPLADDTNINVDPATSDALFNNDQMEVMADVLAQTRIDLQARIDDATAPLRERIAVLEGQLSMLTNLLGSSSSNKSRLIRCD